MVKKEGEKKKVSVYSVKGWIVFQIGYHTLNTFSFNYSANGCVDTFVGPGWKIGLYSLFFRPPKSLLFFHLSYSSYYQTLPKAYVIEANIRGYYNFIRIFSTKNWKEFTLFGMNSQRLDLKDFPLRPATPGKESLNKRCVYDQSNLQLAFGTAVHLQLKWDFSIKPNPTFSKFQFQFILFSFILTFLILLGEYIIKLSSGEHKTIYKCIVTWKM